MYKKCSKCKEEKLFSEFSKNKVRKDGYANQCKLCVKKHNIATKEKRQNYYEVNKDRNKARIEDYRLMNKQSISDQRKEYRKQNKYKIAEGMKEYRELKKIELANQTRLYREINKEKIALQKRIYQKVNRWKINAINAKRRAVKMLATPKWLNDLQYNQIKDFYKEAHRLKLETGQEYHVDHIVPLQGKNVCGLHVPWNLQVIPACENRKKYNKLLEE